MNFNYLLPDKPAPSFVRYIGIILGVLALLAGLYIKYSGAAEILNIKAEYIRFSFLLALFTIITAKNRIEDERITELNLQIFRISFGLVISAVMVMELFRAMGDDQITYEGDFFNMVISGLSFHVLFQEISKYPSVTDFIEKHHDWYRLFMLLAIFGFFFMFRWLWSF